MPIVLGFSTHPPNLVYIPVKPKFTGGELARTNFGPRLSPMVTGLNRSDYLPDIFTQLDFHTS